MAGLRVRAIPPTGFSLHVLPREVVRLHKRRFRVNGSWGVELLEGRRAGFPSKDAGPVSMGITDLPCGRVWSYVFDSQRESVFDERSRS